MKIKKAVKLLISLSLILTMSVTSTVLAEDNKAENTVNQISIDKPVNLKLKVVNSSSVQLSWDQPKAQKELEDGYNIYQNNVVIGSTKEKSYVINNLDATKEYNFYVKTKAKSGQESEASNTVKKREIEKYTYVYNSSGQLTGILFESGKKISYEYDKNGNLKKTTVVNP